MTASILNEIFFRAVFILMISMEVCRGTDSPKSYKPSSPNENNNYQNNYDAELHRPLAVFTERPVNVADFVLIPVVQVPSSDMRMIYRPQIDSVSKTEPIVMCKSSSKSIEATPAVQVPLKQPFYLYDERTVIPFPKTVTILHGGYRMSIPVGVVVALVPAGDFRTGPVFVTTLYAIPAGPVPVTSPVPIRFAPWSYPAAPPQNLAGPPAVPPQYLYQPQAYYSQQSSPLYSPAAPPSPPQYSPAAPPPTSLYSPTAPPSPPYYSQPAPPSPTYYQHSDYSEEANDLRNQETPGKLYTQFSANPPFQNSKESPLLHQLREDAEKNRNKYIPPSYSNQYQVVDA